MPSPPVAPCSSGHTRLCRTQVPVVPGGGEGVFFFRTERGLVHWAVRWALGVGSFWDYPGRPKHLDPTPPPPAK